MQVKTQTDDLQNYLRDASHMPGGYADKLFIPSSVHELSQVLRDANESQTPVTISGARTGTVGGAIPFGGCVVSLERLNNIVEINKESMSVTAEAGVILGDLQKAVEAEGLFYPPDPTEWSCQIGGNVATNASGARSFKYGSTRDYVKRLKVILVNGETIDIRRSEIFADNEGIIEIVAGTGSKIRAIVPTYERPDVRKNVSGYFNGRPLDAIDLFIGSEGTLGVIAEVELALLNKPESTFSGIVFFPNQDDLLDLVGEVRNLSVVNRVAGSSDPLGATLIEYFDSRSLSFISEKFPETPSSMAGAIYFEQETNAGTEYELLERWNGLLHQYGADVDRSWFATSGEDRERMRRFRHALPIACNERYVRYGFKKVSTDMAVPVDRFRGLLKFYEAILSSSSIEYVIFGHIGDCHLHANLFPKTEAEAERARHIYGRCVAQVLMLGGTVSAEHGIGKLKRKYLSTMMGERYLNEMALLKNAFDPSGILGRGNMFDESYL